MRLLYTWLFLSALVLSSCDSGEPRFDDHPLIGSWTPQSTAQRTLTTVNQAQQVVDRREPGTGDLGFAGEAAGDLRYPFVSRDGESVTVFTIDTRFHPFPDRYVFLVVNEFTTSVTAWTNGEYVQYSHPHPYGEPPHTYEQGVLSFGDLTLQSTDGATVNVAGSLTIPMRTLEAGTEYEVETHIETEDSEDLTLRYVFEPDGRLRAERLSGSDRPSYSGSWEDTGDGHVHLTVETESQPITVEYAYLVENGTLLLSTTRERCQSQPACLEQYENQYALIAGSMTHVRQTNEIAFSPTAE